MASHLVSIMPNMARNPNVIGNGLPLAALTSGKEAMPRTTPTGVLCSMAKLPAAKVR